jgi:hypothetical protein
MAFNAQNFALASGAGNQPLTTLADGTFAGCFREYNYYTADAQGVVVTPGYFNSVASVIATGDYVTVYSTGGAGTLIKFRMSNVNNVITLASIGAVIEGTFTFTGAQIDSMYATPLPLFPALVQRAMWVVEVAIFTVTPGTAFAGGGNIGIQYGSAPGLAGVNATGTISTVNFIAIATPNVFTLNTVIVPTSTPQANTIGQGLYLSNLVGPYTGGNGAVITVTLKADLVRM